MPTAVAIQWVEVTTPNVPSISGRVVKGLGLMLLMGSDQGSVPARAVSVYIISSRLLRCLALMGLYAKKFAFLRPGYHIAWHGHSTGDPMAVIDRARGTGT
jgi:hypothetical protein